MSTVLIVAGVAAVAVGVGAFVKYSKDKKHDAQKAKDEKALADIAARAAAIKAVTDEAKRINTTIQEGLTKRDREVTDFTDEEFDAERAADASGVNKVEAPLPPVAVTPTPRPVTPPPLTDLSQLVTASPKPERSPPFVPDKPAPAGWHYTVNGLLRKLRTKDSLWDFTNAKRVRQIDFSKLSRGADNTTASGIYTAGHDTVYKVADKDFYAYIAGTSTFTYGMMYLCDENGKVYDMCSSAPGASTRTPQGNMKRIDYIAGSIPGGPYVVQSSDSSAINCIYVSNKRTAGKLQLNDKLGYKDLPQK